jgi:hypothetical protein
MPDHDWLRKLYFTYNLTFRSGILPVMIPIGVWDQIAALSG